MAEPTYPQPESPTRDNVAVVIPALNESLRIREVVEDALAHCDCVIVVDDGSEDDTLAQIADLDITVLRHPRRMGKGAALRDGFREARRLGMRGVLTMDGDGQHSGADIPRLLDAATRHPGCVIIGARLRKRATQPWYRRLGNDFGDWGIGWACGFRVVDSQSGQRFYPYGVYTLDDVPGEGFVLEAQLLISGGTASWRGRGGGPDRHPLRQRRRAAAVSQESFPPVPRPLAHHLARRRPGLEPRRHRWRVPSYARAATVDRHGQPTTRYRRHRAP